MQTTFPGLTKALNTVAFSQMTHTQLKNFDLVSVLFSATRHGFCFRASPATGRTFYKNVSRKFVFVVHIPFVDIYFCCHVSNFAIHDHTNMQPLDTVLS